MGKKKHRYKLGRLLVLVIGGAGIYLFINFAAYRTSMSAELERNQVLLERNADLQHTLAYRENTLEFIGTDEYIEQEARARLGWVRPGEVMYVDASEAAATRDRERATATPTPTPPGPVQTARPSVPIPGQSTPTPKPTSALETSAPESPEPTATRTLPPEPSSTSTPKDIG